MYKIFYLFLLIQAEHLTFSDYEKSKPLEIMSQRANKLREFCGENQKTAFKMNKNAKVTVKGQCQIIDIQKLSNKILRSIMAVIKMAQNRSFVVPNCLNLRL